MIQHVLLIVIFSVILSSAHAQKNKSAVSSKPVSKTKTVKVPLMPSDTDTSYCVSYTNKITGRIYMSQKYTRLRLINSNDNYTLDYRPNTTLNLGVGATYKWATLNLAYGFPFLNPEEGKGKTKYLDLQAHVYGRKLTIDFFGQFYKGFYLYPQGTSVPESDQWYKRPDLRVNEIGISVQYLLNNRRFSYRAAFLQNEWQKKSCGSLIGGAEIHTGILQADSSMIPSDYKTDSVIEKINRFTYFEIGPNVGYAYTLVVKKHFFLTASLALSLDYGTNKSQSLNSPDVRTTGFTPNNIFRIFAGYNSALNAFSITFINSHVSLSNQKSATNINLDTGNLRINYVKRFRPGPKSRKVLKHI